MAVATYTSDISTAISTVDSATLIEMGSPWASGSSLGAEPDYFIQGAGAFSQLPKSGINSMVFDNTTAIAAIPADGAFTAWVFVVPASLLATDANGGLRLVMGSATTAFKGWNLGGKDSYVYGGWVNLAVNPAINGGTPDYTVGGGGTTSYRYVGSAANLTSSPSRGQYYNMDCLRGGRCEARIAGGTSTDADASFAGFAAVNDDAANRWGLLQAVGGGYLWKGLLTIGYGAACQFTDANTQVLVDRTPKVTAAFNKIEIRNASTQVNWTGISFLSLTGNGSTIANTASPGRLEVVDDCDVNIAGCSFTGMDTLIFKAASDVLTSIFRNCGQVTAGGANFAGTQFLGYEGSSDSSYMLWNTNTDPASKFAGCRFVKGTAATHAISFTDTNLTSIHIPNTCTFEGYNAADAQNDSTIYVAKDSGTVTIYYDGEISVKSAGATVSVEASEVTLTIDANVDLTGAEIRVYDLNGTLPYLGTELAGVESCPTETYDYTGPAGNTVYLQVIQDGYVEYGQQLVMPTADQTLSISLIYDVSAEVTVEEGDLPTIVDVDPNPSYAGQQVTIIGTNFDIAPVTVDFGGVPAVNVSVINSTTLTCIVPVHDDGYVGIMVINADGSSDPYSFLYQTPPEGGSFVPTRRQRLGALLQT